MSDLVIVEQPVFPPALPIDSHKGVAGRLLLFAGSESMPGAAILAVRAAQRAGAGLVTLAAFDQQIMNVAPASTPETTYLDLSDDRDLIASRFPRPVRALNHHVRVAGPGLGQSARIREFIRQLIGDTEFEGPLVLDADALTAIRAKPEQVHACIGDVVLTPHPGEAKRMLDRECPRDHEGRIEAALELARRAGAVCVLKGPQTIVTDGSRVYINQSGNEGMASAGVGDVLVGILGAYLAHAQRSEDGSWGAFEAAAAAVWVHGVAGDIARSEKGTFGMIASDLIEALPRAQIAFDPEG
ncbi:MAG: hydroxyethylthiazole kinase-like uncharacterized protein yjeF [Planctomycetota bacterium]|jgi:hydroxyethylthiazole kinase-like uncharacterized protein yjeF